MAGKAVTKGEVLRSIAESTELSRKQVSAVFEAYRVESALDDVLTGTMKQLASLMKDRGLR